MTFLVTPEEALPCAERLRTHLAALSGKLHVEAAAWHDSPYRTTLHRKQGRDVILYEVQGTLGLHARLKNFAQWLAANRHPSELYLVAEEDSSTTAHLFSELRQHGVGLIVLKDSGAFETTLDAVNPALRITPDPSLALGQKRKEVYACVKKFNDGHRKDGLRDLCEMVERETKSLLVKASKKGWISLTETTIEGQDWSDHINSLASSKIAQNSKPALIDPKLKDDLHSFRGARNLVDHPATSTRQEQRRQRQFPERMLMGTRLVADLEEIKRRIR